MGYNPITRAEIRQYAADHDKRFSPWLIRMILRLDRVLLHQASEYHDGKNKNNAPQPEQPAKGVVYVGAPQTR